MAKANVNSKGEGKTGEPGKPAKTTAVQVNSEAKQQQEPAKTTRSIWFPNQTI
jgi:hypothetical protein